MAEVEDMATRAPLNAKILALDTVHQQDQRRQEYAKMLWGGIPKVKSYSAIVIYAIVNAYMQ